ncbi:MAG: hypothetical protein U1E36_00775 [Rickettsiales bacterium]
MPKRTNTEPLLLVYNAKPIQLTPDQAQYWNSIGRSRTLPSKEQRNLAESDNRTLTQILHLRLRRSAAHFESYDAMLKATHVKDLVRMRDGDLIPEKDDAVILDLFFIKYAGFDPQTHPSILAMWEKAVKIKHEQSKDSEGWSGRITSVPSFGYTK